MVLLFFSRFLRDPKLEKTDFVFFVGIWVETVFKSFFWRKCIKFAKNCSMIIYILEKKYSKTGLTSKSRPAHGLAYRYSPEQYLDLRAETKSKFLNEIYKFVPSLIKCLTRLNTIQPMMPGTLRNYEKH